MTRKEKWKILRALPVIQDDQVWYEIVAILDKMVSNGRR